MAKSKSTKAEKGTYGKLSTPKAKPRGKDAPSSKPDKSSSSQRKKAKMESAAKKSVVITATAKGKVKMKHHVAKVPRKTIKERMNLVSDKPAKEKKFGKFSLGSTKPTKKRKKSKSKPKRPEFQMEIADSNHDYFLRPGNVPWHMAEMQERFRDNATPIKNEEEPKCNVESKKQTKKTNDDEETLQLPSNQVLSHLDAEIQSFSAYVRLTPSERRARNAFLSHITDILTSQFANGGRNGYRYRGQRGSFKTEDGEDENDKIYVEPFGSFATQQVCTFASDVDMCLWGLVKEEEKPNSHLKFVSSDSYTNDDENAGENDILKINQQRDECPLLTESSLLRTMDAIQSAQAKNLKQNESSERDEVTPEESEVENSTGNLGLGDDCLFVIDRVGEALEVVEESEEIGVNDGGESDIPSANPGHRVDISNPDASSENKQTSEELANSKPKDNALKSHFQFTIDVDGVRELGGEVEDMPEHEPTLQSQNNTVSEDKLGSENEAAIANQVESKKSPDPKVDQSNETAINVDDESTGDDRSEEVIVVDDDDSADKLDSFYSRQNVNDATRVEHENLEQETTDVISVNDSSEGSVVDDCDRFDEEPVLELSVTSNSISNPSLASKPLVKPSFGPTGKTRVRVISVLQGLTSHLRRSSFTNTIECRSRARVPIINCTTRTGFDGDIAIGGHNGVDTSTYALRQVNRFRSFAPIVLVLKVLMVQQGLDKPFTGGLGSYKLYVLVAHHIESHIANGGNDRPSEILISLLFRYSCVGSPGDKATTDLETIRNSDGMVSSDDGICDLTPVFRMPDIVEMFRECHERLFDRLLLAEGFDDGECSDNLSYLSSIIDCFRLQEARESSDRRSRLSEDICRPIGRDHPGKVGNSRRVGKVFSKHDSGSDYKRPREFQDNAFNKKRRSFNDIDLPKRGPRGGLVPLHRPDLAAYRSLRTDPEKELLLRGTKNRKNKKKQARDEVIRSFARRSI